MLIHFKLCGNKFLCLILQNVLMNDFLWISAVNILNCQSPSVHKKKPLKTPPITIMIALMSQTLANLNLQIVDFTSGNYVNVICTFVALMFGARESKPCLWTNSTLLFFANDIRLSPHPVLQ